jgi:hypothetical protein
MRFAIDGDWYKGRFPETSPRHERGKRPKTKPKSATTKEKHREKNYIGNQRESLSFQGRHFGLASKSVVSRLPANRLDALIGIALL